MIIFSILALISLVGLVMLLKHKMSTGVFLNTTENIDLHLGKPFIEEIKYITLKKTRQYGYVALFITIRLYVITSKFIRENTNKFLQNIKSKLQKSNGKTEPGSEQTSNFLNMVSEYKKKIKKLHHKIKKEEENAIQ